MGVPLIPGRAGARAFETHRAEPGASGRRRTASIGAVAVAVLAAAVVVGVAPLPAASAIALLVPAAVVDVEEHRLPDVWVGAALVALVGMMTVASASGHRVDAVGAIAGGLVMAIPPLVLHLVSPDAMGFGDVKAAAVLGAALGSVDWRLAAVALCVAALLGSLVGLVSRRRTIAFGPHLVLAAIVVLLAQAPILALLLDEGSRS